MLQCTAVTLLPPDAVLRLTAPGADGPDHPEPLFDGHPSGHGWEVTDPTDEAITRDLARRHPHLFR
ncbi:hypothetical protein [Streptomyces sp. NPDC055886]